MAIRRIGAPRSLRASAKGMKRLATLGRRSYIPGMRSRWRVEPTILGNIVVCDAPLGLRLEYCPQALGEPVDVRCESLPPHEMAEHLNAMEDRARRSRSRR